ncbi:MAG TPA: phosphate ABC transporter substrate-binding protein PstS [Pusillimonas sp.]|uniref:phosphate ABC transporter substrate-binding protein PstS n=1 Tax=unclassified Pusillimonas TaxID=2640016 RepID=UPI0026094E2B|nr:MULTISPECIES: phosphate ABC transporter substrate-binding protein PstS [unclassified Pusillimonas]HLU19300.1 phosphate ABC transporter substrate-binding protein PstS [Pusillimonas sp.]
MFKRVILQAAVGIAFGAASLAAQAVDITGAGASFPYPIYAKWAAQYQQETGNRINYQSIGSGGGQQQIIAKTVDFGASDDPMKAEDLEKNNLLQFPAIVGGTVPVVNIDGIKPGELKLSGPIVADIFLAKIKKWNDPAIQEINPDLKLPNADIVVVHRSDGSGTTFGWTNYLSKVSPAWKETVGEGKAVKWPTGQGGKGNEGVAAYVRQLRNSIGYVEYAYAKQNQLSWTQLQNQEGKFVQPSQEAFAAAAANADWKGAPGMGVVLTNEPGAESWPVTAASFILMQKVQDKPENGKEVLSFFDWAFKNGADMAVELDYVPLPDTVTDQIRAVWAEEIKAADGSAVWK